MSNETYNPERLASLDEFHARYSIDMQAPVDPAPEPAPGFDDELAAIIERNAAVKRAYDLASKGDWKRLIGTVGQIEGGRGRQLLRLDGENANFANDLDYVVAARNARQHRDIDVLLAKVADQAAELTWRADRIAELEDVLAERSTRIAQLEADLEAKASVVASSYVAQLKATAAAMQPADRTFEDRLATLGALRRQTAQAWKLLEALSALRNNDAIALPAWERIDRLHCRAMRRYGRRQDAYRLLQGAPLYPAPSESEVMETLRRTLREAIEHCETCWTPHNPTCARCKTFIALLNNELKRPTPAAPSESSEGEATE